MTRSMEALLDISPVNSGLDEDVVSLDPPPAAVVIVDTVDARLPSDQTSSSSPNMRIVDAGGEGCSAGRPLKYARGVPTGKKSNKKGPHPYNHFATGEDIYEDDTAYGKHGSRNAGLLLGTTLLPRDRTYLDKHTDDELRTFGAQSWYQYAGFITEASKRLADASSDLKREKKNACSNASKLKKTITTCNEKIAELTKEIEEQKESHQVDVERARNEVVAEGEAKLQARVAEMQAVVAKYKANKAAESDRKAERVNQKMALLNAEIGRLKNVLKEHGIPDYEIDAAVVRAAT